MAFNPKKILAVVFFLIGLYFLLDIAIQTEKWVSWLCLLPIMLSLFIVGAFLWSGGKKDDVRDAEIEEKSAKVEAMKSEQAKFVKVKCPKCKALNEEDSEFCKTCGKKL